MTARVQMKLQMAQCFLSPCGVEVNPPKKNKQTKNPWLLNPPQSSFYWFDCEPSILCVSLSVLCSTTPAVLVRGEHCSSSVCYHRWFQLQCLAVSGGCGLSRWLPAADVTWVPGSKGFQVRADYNFNHCYNPVICISKLADIRIMMSTNYSLGGKIKMII